MSTYLEVLISVMAFSVLVGTIGAHRGSIYIGRMTTQLVAYRGADRKSGANSAQLDPAAPGASRQPGAGGLHELRSATKSADDILSRVDEVVEHFQITVMPVLEAVSQVRAATRQVGAISAGVKAGWGVLRGIDRLGSIRITAPIRRP